MYAANNLRKLKISRSQGTRVKKKGRTFSSNLTANYELMLRLYLLNKEQSSSKREVKYTKLNSVKKTDFSKAYSSFRNNIAQVIQKANQLINTFNRSGIQMVRE